MVERTARAPSADPAPAVGVVFTTYNHAHFLDAAIDSVLAQTVPVAEILIVDDGSTDDPAAVAAKHPRVRLIRQSNQGLAAARNTGLHHARADKLIFLDADDRLLPNAVTAGLTCFAKFPECGFVYGGYRNLCLNGHWRSADYYNPVSGDPYLDFLTGNLVGMHAAVMYDRAKLIAIGAFDSTLRRCEDYDVYLRMSRALPVASHPHLVAEYRWHGGNVSGNHREMLDWSLRVHRREMRRARETRETARAWRRGRARWRRMYVSRMIADAKRAWTGHRSPEAVRAMRDAVAAGPLLTARLVLGTVRRRLTRRLSSSLIHHRHSPVHEQLLSPPLGAVQMGDLDRLTPVSAEFGFDRGTPVDRYYIERFVARHAADIGGRVLEIKDDSYCRRFAAGRIARQEILDLSSANRQATIVGDLSDPRTLPAGQFDCFVVTQTLHLIFDLPAAVAQIHRALAPGGVVLATVPGISPIDRGAARATWCWSLAPNSARRLFSRVFGEDNVRVESHGNVYAATAFLHGLAVEDLDPARLEIDDESYPVVVTVRAQKRRAGP